MVIRFEVFFLGGSASMIPQCKPKCCHGHILTMKIFFHFFSMYEPTLLQKVMDRFLVLSFSTSLLTVLSETLSRLASSEGDPVLEYVISLDN